MSKKLYEIISKVMSVPVTEINDQSGPKDIEAWDSFNGLVLIDELEQNFNIKFTLDEATDVTTVEDIKRHMKNHGITLDD